MVPSSTSEKLLYNTVRIVTDGGTGTGFLFYLRIDDQNIPVIITNKHVVNDKTQEKTTISIHTTTDGMHADESVAVTLDIEWIFHPEQDLCMCAAAPFFDLIKERTGKNALITPIAEDLIASDEDLKELRAIEDVTMVGYPIGLCDEKNNFPLFRRGITASHPLLDFNGTNIGAVDLACFPGSSGSPIFILNENGFTAKNGNTVLGVQRVLLLGILYAGPIFNAQGEVVIREIPTQKQAISTTPQMIHIGYYIKSNEILVLKSILEERFKSEKD